MVSLFCIFLQCELCDQIMRSSETTNYAKLCEFIRYNAISHNIMRELGGLFWSTDSEGKKYESDFRYRRNIPKKHPHFSFFHVTTNSYGSFIHPAQASRGRVRWVPETPPFLGGNPALFGSRLYPALYFLF